MTDFAPLAALLADLRLRIDQQLESHLNSTSGQSNNLDQALRYVLLGGGKRIRGILVHAACTMAGGHPEQGDIPASAIEMLHAYSLVHDDLPAMDNDELRRGKPTCHVAYNEATAILVGDTLHTLTFELLARKGQYQDSTRVAMINTLAQAAGQEGMAAGQMLDIEANGLGLTLEALEEIHYLKTGRLITGALLLGAQAAETSDSSALAEDLTRYGNAIGLAFQIQDDILDVTASTETLGKPGGSDQRQGKATFPGLIGLEASRERTRKLCEQACSHLQHYGQPARVLLDLADYIVSRAH